MKLHSEHDSKCYYVVRNDGTMSDFSYRKCVEGCFPDGIKATRAKASINRKGEGTAEEAVVGDTMAAAAVAVVTDATNL